MHQPITQPLYQVSIFSFCFWRCKCTDPSPNPHTSQLLSPCFWGVNLTTQASDWFLSWCFQRCKFSNPTLLLCTAILDIHLPTQSAPTTHLLNASNKNIMWVKRRAQKKEGAFPQTTNARLLGNKLNHSDVSHWQGSIELGLIYQILYDPPILWKEIFQGQLSHLITMLSKMEDWIESSWS
jgi:hypothetical protein